MPEEIKKIEDSLDADPLIEETLKSISKETFRIS